MDHLIDLEGLSGASMSYNSTPYRYGLAVDAIPVPTSATLTPTQQNDLQSEYRSYVGSLLWIFQGTQPDPSFIISILAKHQLHPIHIHISTPKYSIHYLKGTKSLGITFSNTLQPEI